jgi:hypothetical protein
MGRAIKIRLYTAQTYLPARSTKRRRRVREGVTLAMSGGARLGEASSYSYGEHSARFDLPREFASHEGTASKKSLQRLPGAARPRPIRTRRRPPRGDAGPGSPVECYLLSGERARRGRSGPRLRSRRTRPRTRNARGRRAARRGQDSWSGLVVRTDVPGSTTRANARAVRPRTSRLFFHAFR